MQESKLEDWLVTPAGGVRSANVADGSAASGARAASTSGPVRWSEHNAIQGGKPLKEHLGSVIAVLLMALFVVLALGERPAMPQSVPFPAGAMSLPLAACMALLAAAASWGVGWIILRSQHLHGHLSLDHVDSGPQKMHAGPIPRIGGVAVACGLLAALAGIAVAARLVGGVVVDSSTFFLILLSSVPAFLGGVCEDLTKRVGAFDRLMLSMASGVFAAWLFGAVLTRLEIGWLDALVTGVPLVAILFTAFAVAGVANAMNIIDGFNGLSAGYAVLVLAALGAVAFLLQDSLILQLSLALAGALIGFLCWNWPGGKLFLGDGGAYLTGFLLAELSLMLVMRHDGISPWFPLLLLIYPVVETLYSVYRRKRVLKTAAGEPDCGHLHHLIYAHLMRAGAAGRCATAANPLVALHVVAANLVVVATALAFSESTSRLAFLALVYALGYVLIYRRLKRQSSGGLSIES